MAANSIINIITVFSNLLEHSPYKVHIYEQRLCIDEIIHTVDLSVWRSSASCGYLQFFEEENKLTNVNIIAIYGPMIYTAPYILRLMRANPLQGQVAVGWALEIEQSGDSKKFRFSGRNPSPCPSNGFARIKKHYVGFNQRSIGSFMYMSSLEWL